MQCASAVASIDPIFSHDYSEIVTVVVSMAGLSRVHLIVDSVVTDR
jgi:hypothetical protein